MICTKIYDEPQFNKKEILRYAGVAGNMQNVEDLVDECIDEINGRLSYRVCYTEFPIEFNKDFLELGFMRSNSKALEKNLSGCGSIILFAATVGIEIDRLIARYSALSTTKAYLFNAIGAERIESLCDAFCYDIKRKKSEEGKFIRPRFSAGYGDFPLSAQRDICTVLNCQKQIGVSLNESLLMSPSKSVTAIIGVSNKEQK